MNQWKISLESFLGFSLKDHKNVLHSILSALYMKRVTQIFLLLR